MRQLQKTPSVLRTREILFFLLICLLSVNTSAIGQYTVPIGDSVGVGGIFYYGNPQECNQCEIWNIDCSHREKDFFLEVPTLYPGGWPTQSGGTIIFAPTKIGMQYDTFNIVVDFVNNSGRGTEFTEKAGPVFVSAIGISDSIILFRSLSSENIIDYFWYPDSGKYLSENPPYGKIQPIELVNNVDSTTTFDFKIQIDSSAHIYPYIVFGSDSTALPCSFTLKPKVRRKRGLIYFFTESKGFDTAIIFNAKILGIAHNPTSNDTMLVNYRIRYSAKTKVSVNSSQLQGLENISIASMLNNQGIIIISVFPQPEYTVLELYDALGRQLPLPNSQLQIPAGASSQKLEVGNLSSGCYILRMKLKNQVISKSFVITR